jgi:RsiW-degrading membrane proteinase PrsW (M82 family)
MKFRRSLFITIGSFIVVAVLLNLFLENPTFDKLTDKAEFEQQANQPGLAEVTFLQIIGQDIYNIESHYNYICTHFDIPVKTQIDRYEYEYREDSTIIHYYDSLSLLVDLQLSDIGYYGSGLIAVFLENYTTGLDYFFKVRNRDQEYLNNSIGNAYNQIDSLKQAEYYFRKEIENQGNLEGAYPNLIHLLYYNGEIGELQQLLEDRNVKPYFPAGIARAVYFKGFQPVSYARSILRGMSYAINIWGFIAAFLIMLCWIIYLRKLDIFEVEKWRHVVITVGLGMLFCFFVYPLSDFNNLIIGFTLNGEVINDFLYCVIGIGAIEEFVKIIPLLLMLKFTKAINEPFDYIKYASLSALGFAFVENLLYFDESSLHIIHGRALTAVVSHMFDSSIIAYGLMLNKYKKQWNPYLNFIAFFALASLAHGFYDFWLINEAVSDFSFVTFIFLLASLFIWNFFKDSALSNSEFFDANKSIDNGKLEDYLMYSLAGVLLFEFVAIAFKFSPEIANSALLNSLYSGTYLIVFLSMSLSKISLNKWKWTKAA